MVPEDRTERVRRRAYELWERAGRPSGRDAEHWAQAEQEVLAEDGGAAAQATGLATGDLGPGGDSIGAVAGSATATGIGYAGGDARPPGARPAGTRGAGGTGGEGQAADTAGAGGPATPGPAAGGAEGGAGPGIGGPRMAPPA